MEISGESFCFYSITFGSYFLSSHSYTKSKLYWEFKGISGLIHTMFRHERQENYFHILFWALVFGDWQTNMHVKNTDLALIKLTVINYVDHIVCFANC